MSELKKSRTAATATTTSSLSPSANSLSPSLTNEQTKALSALQARVQESTLEVVRNEKSSWLDNPCLLRYLRARDWNVDKAFNALVETVKWRSETKPYDITAEQVASQLAIRLIYRNGVDKQGRPVMMIKPTGYNPDPVDKRVKGLTYQMEEAIASMSPGVEKMTWIIDFSYFVRKERPPDVRPTARAVVNMLENHYPERLGSLYILNAPWMLSILAFMLRPFMNSVTRQKMHWLRGNKDYLFKTLSTIVDADQLEVGLGGTNKFSHTPLVRKGTASDEEVLANAIKSTLLFSGNGSGGSSNSSALSPTASPSLSSTSISSSSSASSPSSPTASSEDWEKVISDSVARTKINAEGKDNGTLSSRGSIIGNADITDDEIVSAFGGPADSSSSSSATKEEDTFNV